MNLIQRLRLFLTATFICAICADACIAQKTAESKHIAVPNVKLLGNSLGAVKAFDGRIDRQILPESIHFDLDGDVVYGLIATYPENVKFEHLIDAINSTQKKWWRDSDRKMADHGVSVWRNEKSRVAYQASGTQLIMIWLDRRVSDRDRSEPAEATSLIEAANQEAAADKAKEEKD
jgi:hypothetical protein